MFFMKLRSELRKQAMTYLYQIDVLQTNKVPCDIEEILTNDSSTRDDFIKDIVFGVEKNKPEIDEIANKYLKNWRIDRLDKTGAAILRMAIYEMKYLDTPPIVVINEAIELAKIYTDEELVKMINAVLDKYMKDL